MGGAVLSVHTDLVQAACDGCETTWDLWGTWSPDGFVPEDYDDIRCPECLEPGYVERVGA